MRAEVVLGLSAMMTTRRQLSGTLQKLKLNYSGGDIGIIGLICESRSQPSVHQFLGRSERTIERAKIKNEMYNRSISLSR